MSEREYKVEMFRPKDAPGVAQLFNEVYGSGYPVKIVYNPEQLVAGFESGQYIPILARTPENRIVGYTALYRSAPYAGLYEVGQTLVLPDYRKTPLAGFLFRYTMRAAPKIPGIEALFCEGVCNHTIIQRAGLMFKYVEMAIEIDLMPAEAYEKERNASGRVSAVGMFKTYVQRPHAVFVPAAYENYSRFAFNGLDDTRSVNISTENLPSAGPTEIASQVFESPRLARVTVHQAGGDFEAVFDEEEKRIEKDTPCEVIQVWLKLSWPWVGAVVDILKSRGFFLGGILPRWFGEDGFLMQKVLTRPNWEGINLHTDRASQILRFIQDDWKSFRGKLE